LAKVIAEKGGSTAADMFKSLTGQNTPAGEKKDTAPQESSTTQRKMKGPSVKLDDIPDLSKAESSKEETKQSSGMRKRKEHEA
jgi:hypothetical protein